jgi:rubrerythrin
MLEKAQFTRTQEDFVCDVCGTPVHGNGYTNHCPNCLASKHVDVNPGDRASSCHGIMEPVGMEIRKGKEYIIHECVKCGHTRANKVSDNDNRDTLRLVASHTWIISQFQR